ncbi:hypothetical protein THASP1DRAFT_28958 [Thamnocephalis sphaerospora]|uniref:Uncharacterized protein n=1 Tax=Thamnocephalis sphaerospora TaxID=78915 RepID=A0A4P9XTD6_9FUNG|nr:hypothetical protein THASP1DRAFT_28958 [Thamnocephalis sphaerospora]|eukprot:RKP09252.1 hypothetical protein THASP1DRAFT_28958 [Thamnocephalis sphaerospora]
MSAIFLLWLPLLWLLQNASTASTTGLPSSSAVSLHRKQWPSVKLPDVLNGAPGPTLLEQGDVSHCLLTLYCAPNNNTLVQLGDNLTVTWNVRSARLGEAPAATTPIILALIDPQTQAVLTTKRVINNDSGSPNASIPITQALLGQQDKRPLSLVVRSDGTAASSSSSASLSLTVMSTLAAKASKDGGLSTSTASLTDGAISAIVIGVIAFFVFDAIVIAVVLIRRRRRHRQKWKQLHTQQQQLHTQQQQQQQQQPTAHVPTAIHAEDIYSLPHSNAQTGPTHHHHKLAS